MAEYTRLDKNDLARKMQYRVDHKKSKNVKKNSDIVRKLSLVDMYEMASLYLEKYKVVGVGDL